MKRSRPRDLRGVASWTLVPPSLRPRGEQVRADSRSPEGACCRKWVRIQGSAENMQWRCSQGSAFESSPIHSTAEESPFRSTPEASAQFLLLAWAAELRPSQPHCLSRVSCAAAGSHALRLLPRLFEKRLAECHGPPKPLA